MPTGRSLGTFATVKAAKAAIFAAHHEAEERRAAA
jgi:hypothetical protein